VPTNLPEHPEPTASERWWYALGRSEAFAEIQARRTEVHALIRGGISSIALGPGGRDHQAADLATRVLALLVPPEEVVSPEAHR